MVAVKFAVVAPDATVTEPGTVAAPLLVDSDITAPAPEAGCVIVTVHEDVLPEATLVGLHERLLRLVGRMTEMLPPAPPAEIEEPVVEVATTFVTAILTVPVAPADNVAFTTATTPFPMVF
jgi:hypothetical protein